MNFGTWKVKTNSKDYLEFLHKNPNNNEFEVVKTIKFPLKHKLKKKKKLSKLPKLKIKSLSSKNNKNNKNNNNKNKEA